MTTSTITARRKGDPQHHVDGNYPGEGPTTDWVSHPLKGSSPCKVVCCEGIRVSSTDAWLVGLQSVVCSELVCSRLRAVGCVQSVGVQAVGEKSVGVYAVRG